MKTNHIILLTILTLGGLTVNREIFSAQLPHRAVPVPAVRSTPVPRPVITPPPAPVPPAVEPIAISCETSAASNIAVTGRGGQTGAPAGFSIQWMTLADYVALGNHWPVTSQVPNPAAPSFCRATFGVPVMPGCTGYNLLPGQSVTVTIGDDSLYDNCAVSSPCSGSPLLCNTAYVFRASAASNVDLRSNTIMCATLPCVGSSCTYTQGYWRTHPDAWPVTSLTLGTVTYQAAELMAILDNPAQGNGYLAPGQTGDLTETLTEYNEGTIGPGHCND